MKLFTLLFISVVIQAKANDTPRAKVIAVLDGNTIEVLAGNGERSQLILYGIDCPDSGQHFALEAKQLMTEMLLGKSVAIVMHGKDRLGNLLGEVTVDGAPNPQREMIRRGFAWITDPNDDYELLKEHVRKLGLGLWQEENPTPPWLYRRRQSMMVAKSS